MRQPVDSFDNDGITDVVAWRNDAGAAKNVFDGLFKEDSTNTRLLWQVFLGESIDYVAGRAPDRWGISLFSDAVRFNVGQVECLLLLPAEGKILVAPNFKRKGIELGNRSYPRAGGSRLANLAFASADRLAQLRRAHQLASDLAAKRTATSAIKGAHSPGVLRYLESVIGRKLPDPSYYSTDIPAQPKRIFTHYWTSNTWNENDGEPIRYTAGNRFKARGLRSGDRVYIITNRAGQLYVGAFVDVAEVADKRKALRLLKGDLWDANDFAIPSNKAMFSADRKVELDQAKKIRFLPHHAEMKMTSGQIDRQTLRGLREITFESAQILDRALGIDAADRGDFEVRIIEQRLDIGATQKETLILARRGQGVYRANLERIENSCRVTGISNGEFLRASHIKPWAESNDREKLDGHNGLLLAPHVDHLFDRGWISFSDTGELLISEKMDASVLRAWGIAETLNVGAFRKQQCTYLAWHRRAFGFPG